MATGQRSRQGIDKHLQAAIVWGKAAIRAEEQGKRELSKANFIELRQKVSSRKQDPILAVSMAAGVLAICSGAWWALRG